MKKTIVIADWAGDSLCTQEVRSSIAGSTGETASPDISFVQSSRSTVHTGFLARQVVETEERYGKPLDTVILLDCNLTGQAEFLAVKLHSGLFILGPNSGYSFSFLLGRLEVVFSYPGIDGPHEFPARDSYSRVTAHFINSQEDDLALEEVSHACIRPLLDMKVGHISSQGNLILTARQSELREKHAYEDKVQIEIGQNVKVARFLPGISHGEKGELIIHPSALGDPHDPFLQISMVSGEYSETASPTDLFSLRFAGNTVILV